MKSRDRIVILALAISSLVEAGVIVYLLRVDDAPAVSASILSSGTQIENRAVSAADDHSRSVDVVVQEPPTPATSGAPSVAVVLADLTKRGGVRASVQFLGKSDEVSDSFAELFALSASERSALDQAVRSCRRELVALVEEHSRVVQLESGTVEISVDPFEAVGGRLYDSLIASIGQVLGAERAIAFSRLTGSQLDDAFGDFGAAARKLTITPAKTSEGIVTFEVFDRSDRGIEQSTSSRHYKDIHELARHNPNFAKILRGKFQNGE